MKKAIIYLILTILAVVGEIQFCNKVEKIYKEAGWRSVVCKTSSENGERPGLTGLRLYR